MVSLGVLSIAYLNSASVMVLSRFVLLSALLAVAVQGRTLLAIDNKPDSPPYEVKNSTKALEVREYTNGKLRKQ